MKPDHTFAWRYHVMAEELRAKAEFPPYVNIRTHLLEFAEQWESLAGQANSLTHAPDPIELGKPQRN